MTCWFSHFELCRPATPGAGAVGELEQQLEDAQDLLAGAKRRSRAAAAALRDARRVLDRLRKSRPA